MDVDTLIDRLQRFQKALAGSVEPMVTAMERRGTTPFRVLVATMLSLRTRDTVTAVVAEALFARADSPRGILELPLEDLTGLIKPVGFYRTKARQLRETCRRLLSDHAGRVPDELEALLALPGVGRKTANLVLAKGFGKPGLCVDTHVHRIMNRIGAVATRHPDETETVLRQVLPAGWWVAVNDILVAWGQQVCTPLSPFCSRCPINDSCPRNGVARMR
jgi:endonuclease-3